MMITIGIQLGGPEQSDSLILSGLALAMNVAADVRDAKYDDGTEAWVNLIYLVPGSIIKPDFVGYQIGKFSRKKMGLAIAIAVPKSVADGKDIPVFVASSLRDAVRLASSHFATKGIPFSISKAEGIVLAIEDEFKK